MLRSRKPTRLLWPIKATRSLRPMRSFGAVSWLRPWWSWRAQSTKLSIQQSTKVDKQTMSQRAVEADKPKPKRPERQKVMLWPKSKNRPKIKFRSKARLQSMAKLRPKAKLWLVAIEFWQLLTISPSQNITCQSKAVNGILIFFVLTEAVATINWEDPLWKVIGAVCAPSETALKTDSTTN